MVVSNDVRDALTTIGLWCIENDEDDVMIKFNCIRNKNHKQTIRMMSYLDGDWDSVGKVTLYDDGTIKGEFNAEDGVSLWDKE